MLNISVSDQDVIDELSLTLNVGRYVDEEFVTVNGDVTIGEKVQVKLQRTGVDPNQASDQFRSVS